MVANNSIKVLIVEDNYDYASMLLVVLGETSPGEFNPAHVHRLENALASLDKTKFDIILLDLLLPDSQGLDTLYQVREHAPDVPVVILTALDDRDLAIKAVRHGAQDYLEKSMLNEKLLLRTLVYALERHKALKILEQQTLIDDLTGLLNRRGFLSLAQQQVKIAKRANWESMLLFADLDGLKEINDHFGHSQGDRALKTVAGILKETFRSSDVIARIGGDEFIVLALKASHDSIKAMTARIQERIHDFNSQNRAYSLSLSFGLARFDPEERAPLEEAIANADRALYEQKRSKSKE